ncbi:MAG: ABC transporter permease [Burkholderiaceae bacterium]
MPALSWRAAVAASLRRELRIVAARPWEIFAVVIAPLVWMGLTWAVLTGGLPTQLPVALVDEDNSAASRQVARAIGATRSAQLVPTESLPAARAALMAGKVYGVVYLPLNYEREMLRGGQLPVVLYLNEMYYPTAGALEKDARAAISAVMAERSASLAARAGGGFAAGRIRVEALQADFTSLGNPALNYEAYLGATLLPGLLQLFAVMAFIGAIVRETREKTAADWLATAGGRFGPALIGKLIPFVALYLLLGAAYVAWVSGYAGWAPAGSTTLWVIATDLLVLSMLSIAVLFAALAPDWRMALTLGSLYVAPALPFSGFSYPLASMSESAQAFGHTLPITWYLQAQAQQWTLASPFSHSASTLAILAGFAFLPWLIGAPLLARKMRRAAEAAS